MTSKRFQQFTILERIMIELGLMRIRLDPDHPDYNEQKAVLEKLQEELK